MAEDQKQPERKERKQSFSTSGLIEIYIWLFIAFVAGFRPLFYGATYGLEEINFFLDFYGETLLSILILLFPHLFKLIYNELPFEYLRNRRRIAIGLNTQESLDELNNHQNKEQEFTKSKLELKDVEPNQFEINLKKSQRVADKIYARGGAYLLIGCLIAFAGVLFFYFQTVALPISNGTMSYSRLLLEYLPRLGTLIFVEAIAFFFLRQYRRTMDEFRYYDSIKRQRENQLAVFKLVVTYSENPVIFEKIIGFSSFNEEPNRLIPANPIKEKEVTSEETLIDKILELIKLSKK
jgi:hypothetical protein